MDETLRKAALDYHRLPRAGKLSVESIKRMATQRDLALAYSPGVAAVCEAIKAHPESAHDYTARGNLVAVISNGTAVLGLGNIGPLASKPVMEGKAVLFKKFAGIDVFDIEVDAADPARFCDVVAALEPTFGAINLEDIKAPECFGIEAELRARMRIPVFHDDQHGTAITVAAAVRNGLLLQRKTLADVKLVTSGAGAAALACVDLLVAMGLRPENVTLTDIAGVVRTDREGMLPNMARYARDTGAQQLVDVSAGDRHFPRPVGAGRAEAGMAAYACGTPADPGTCQSRPGDHARPGTGRAAGRDRCHRPQRLSEPGEQRPVFSVHLPRRAGRVSDHDQRGDEDRGGGGHCAACAGGASDVVAAAYGGSEPVFGPEYIIPKPFDPRLILQVAPAVARAAMASGVARRPITDFDAYRVTLERFVFRSGQLMQPVFEAARKDPRRIVYAEGEDERVLRAAQMLVDDGIARPILLGNREVIARKMQELGLRLDLDRARDRARPGGGSRRCSVHWCRRISNWSGAAAFGPKLPRGGLPRAARWRPR